MVELRRLTDPDEIETLFRSVFTQPPWNDDWSDAAQLRAYIADLTDGRGALPLGLYENGVLVGLSLGRIWHWYEGTEYRIDEFCIRADCQRRGLGSRFLRLIEAYAVGRGIRHLFLLTDRGVPAHSFYVKNGFTELPGSVALAKSIKSL